MLVTSRFYLRTMLHCSEERCINEVLGAVSTYYARARVLAVIYTLNYNRILIVSTDLRSILYGFRVINAFAAEISVLVRNTNLYEV